MSDETMVMGEPAPHRVRWTRRQAAGIVESGILRGRFELIDGEILSKMGQKPSHIAVVVLVSAWLRAVFGDLFVRDQAPIDVGTADSEHNEPEPDVAVTGEPVAAFMDRLADPSDLVLVVEVSDSTLHFDLGVKAGLYARAGICEYWVVDIGGRRIVVHRRPSPDGFKDIVTVGEAQEIAPQVRSDAKKRVADLLPPAL